MRYWNSGLLIACPAGDRLPRQSREGCGLWASGCRVLCSAKACLSGQGGLGQTLWGPSSPDQMPFLQKVEPLNPGTGLGKRRAECQSPLAHLPKCSLTIICCSIPVTELPGIVFLGLRGQLTPPPGISQKPWWWGRGEKRGGEVGIAESGIT